MGGLFFHCSSQFIFKCVQLLQPSVSRRPLPASTCRVWSSLLSEHPRRHQHLLKDCRDVRLGLVRHFVKFGPRSRSRSACGNATAKTGEHEQFFWAFIILSTVLASFSHPKGSLRGDPSRLVSRGREARSRGRALLHLSESPKLGTGATEGPSPGSLAEE